MLDSTDGSIQLAVAHRRGASQRSAHPTPPQPPCMQSFTQYIWEMAFYLVRPSKHGPPTTTTTQHRSVFVWLGLAALTLVSRPDRESYSLFIFLSRAPVARHFKCSCHMFSGENARTHSLYTDRKVSTFFLSLLSFFLSHKCEHRAANIVFGKKIALANAHTMRFGGAFFVLEYNVI